MTAMMACFGALPFSLSRSEKARKLGSFRAALRPAMYRTSRRLLRPPPIRRFPDRTPLSRAIGANPARAATWRGVSVPSSGISAMRAVAETGPTPGAVRRRAARSRSSSDEAMQRAMAVSMLSISRCKGRRTRPTEARIALSDVCFKRIFSHFASSTSWRRRKCKALSLLTSFASGAHSGKSSRMAISRITPASTRSVFAIRPSEFAKARARRGLIRIAGTPACASAMRKGVSYPPEASNATRPPLRPMRRAKASRSLLSIRAYPSGPTTSIQLFATSTPKTFSIMIPFAGETPHWGLSSSGSLQSHGIGANCSNQVCRTNHCGRGSSPQAMSLIAQSIQIFSSSRPQPTLHVSEGLDFFETRKGNSCASFGSRVCGRSAYAEGKEERDHAHLHCFAH